MWRSPIDDSVPGFRANIVIESLRGRRRILVVLCRGLKTASSQQATEWRTNLIADGFELDTHHLLLGFPTGLFLWLPNTDSEAPPDFIVSAQSVLERYLSPRVEELGGPDNEDLEVVFSFWLMDLANGMREPDALSEADQMLVTSGLLEKIRNCVFT